MHFNSLNSVDSIIPLLGLCINLYSQYHLPLCTRLLRAQSILRILWEASTCLAKPSLGYTFSYCYLLSFLTTVEEERKGLWRRGRWVPKQFLTCQSSNWNYCNIYSALIPKMITQFIFIIFDPCAYICQENVLTDKIHNNPQLFLWHKHTGFAKQPQTKKHSPFINASQLGLFIIIV